MSKKTLMNLAQVGTSHDIMSNFPSIFLGINLIITNQILYNSTKYLFRNIDILIFDVLMHYRCTD
jgi:hypothetical protein